MVPSPPPLPPEFANERSRKKRKGLSHSRWRGELRYLPVPRPESLAWKCKRSERRRVCHFAYRRSTAANAVENQRRKCSGNIHPLPTALPSSVPEEEEEEEERLRLCQKRRFDRGHSTLIVGVPDSGTTFSLRLRVHRPISNRSPSVRQGTGHAVEQVFTPDILVITTTSCRESNEQKLLLRLSSLALEGEGGFFDFD